MMRILHVFGNLNRGGAESLIMSIYRNIDRTKIQFDFIVHTDKNSDFDKEINELGGKIYSVPKYNASNHLEYIKTWNSFFSEHPEYKVIHGHVRSTASIYLAIAKRHRLKTISHSHSTSSGTGLASIAKNVLQFPIRFISDYFFACSQDAGNWLFGKKICKKNNFYIVNNAIETEKYIYNSKTRNLIREEFDIKNKFVIGHVGSFQQAKNHNFLLEVFKEIHNLDNNSVLMLIGDGNLKEKILNKIDLLGLSDSVILTGVREDVSDLYQAMDIFVFPSIFEGLGIVLIEAQAAGLKSFVSESIPKEAFITNLAKSISINESPDYWAKRILSEKNYIRENTLQKIYKKQYDIKNVSEWLFEFYRKVDSY